MAAGRPKKSAVWSYFTYDKESDISTCVVVISTNEDGEDKLCEKKIKGQFTTNLKKHLKAAHDQEYKIVVKDDEEKKRPTLNMLRLKHKEPSLSQLKSMMLIQRDKLPSQIR
jgi:hypothetical protein